MRFVLAHIFVYIRTKITERIMGLVS